MPANEFLKPSKKFSRQLSSQSKPVRRERRNRVALDAVAGGAVRNDLNPELRLETFAISTLVLPHHEVRKIDTAHVAEVARSLRQFGNVSPPVVSKDRAVIDGVITIKAAESLGMTKLACVVVSHLEPAQLTVLRLALNRLQEKGEWDLGELKDTFEEIAELEIPLELTGFSVEEVDLILEQETVAVDDKGNHVPPLDSRPISHVGDLWYLGRHKHLCGDATDPDCYRRLFADGEKARAIFTDPPYNILLDGFAVGAGKNRHREFVTGSGELSDSDFVKLLKDSLSASSAYLVNGGLIFACMDWRHVEHIQGAARATGLQHINTIVWDKGHGGLGGIYRSAHEFVFLFKKGDAAVLNNVGLGKHGRDRSNVWPYPGVNRRGSTAHAQAAHHPTPKPVELVSDALLDVTAKGDIVLDPFVGSGTTIIAAHSKKRVAYALDLDPLYVDLAIRRFQEFSGIDAVLADTGKTFDEIAAERVEASAQEETNISVV